MSKVDAAVLLWVMLGVQLLLLGFMFMAMWGWFVTPFGIRDIGLAHSLGLAVMLGSLKYRGGIADNKESHEEAVSDAVRGTAGLLFWFFIAFLCHLGM